MAYKWTKTKFRGVRYREGVKKNGDVRKDRYYTIRYKLNGKDKEEALGWESEGWTENKAALKLAELKENQRTGIGEKTLAEKREASAERDRVKQEAEEQIKKENISFDSVFKKYIEQSSRDKKKRTYEVERTFSQKWLIPLLGELPIKNISPFILEKLKKQMVDAGKAPKTIRHVLAIIQQVFNYARNHDLYNGDNPVSKVKKPSEDNRRSRFLSHEEAALLLDALQQVSSTTHNMALLSLHCGLRAGEIFSLTWNDIDFRNGTILIKDTKSGRNRNAVMTSAVRKMFEQRTNHKTSDIVFPSRIGTRMEEVSHTFDRVVTKLGFKANIKDRRQKVVFHTLRHTYASWLVMSGVDLYTVQRLMGHSTISMTERYSHLAPDHLKKAVSKLEDSINQHKQNNIVEFDSIKQSQRK